MLSEFSYPILTVEKYVQTVNFYEDHFEFYPEFEMAGYSVLKRKGETDMFLGVMDVAHEGLPEHYRKTTQGLIINYPVENVDNFYQQAYWEGLNILNEPEIAKCARRYFFITDPNGILVNICQNVDPSKVEGFYDMTLPEQYVHAD